jgi:hypothetical protein
MIRNEGEDQGMRGEELGFGQGQQETSKTLGGPIQLRLDLGVQEQSVLDWTPRPYMESDFDVLYMVGKIFS